MQACRAETRSKSRSALLSPAPAAAPAWVVDRGAVSARFSFLGLPGLEGSSGWEEEAEVRVSPSAAAAAAAAADFPAAAPRESLEARRKEPEEVVRRREGRTSFFCLEAGRISSRSTGTPRETRKRRRMRERIQSGGWSGGGATSCDQREAERGVRKMGLSRAEGLGSGGKGSLGGKRAAR